ncbi:hypothetical protein, partial [Rubrivirga sp.]|uniref:hypothetical protein n=1 Tax=Rubrivirga sp. TaxID=1885344 RepID=UPI003C793D31
MKRPKRSRPRGRRFLRHGSPSRSVLSLCALVILASCGNDVSTAGPFDEPSTAGPFVEGGPGTLFPGLEGAALLDAVDRGYSPARTLGYGPARDEMYGWEQSTYGAVCAVYTGYC